MPKVMLVDDDGAMTKLLKTLLEMEPEGFEVSVAARGEQALAKAQADPPDVFMIDYHLSDMDGLEIVQHLRNMPRFSTTPMVMVSGLDVQDEALQSGIDVFILKPFEPEDLVEVFLDLLS